MPTYQYTCNACDEPLEAVQTFTDDPLTECPACGGELRKVFSPVGVVFKGSGFYRTDSREAQNGKANGQHKGDSEPSGQDSARSKDSGSESGSSESSGSGESASSSGSESASSDGSGKSGETKSSTGSTKKSESTSTAA